MHKMNRILVPVDFSDGAQTATNYAIMLAKQFNAAIDFLNVWEYPYYVGDDVMLQVPGQTAQTIIDYAKEQAVVEMKKFMENLPKETGVEWTENVKGGIVDIEIVAMAKEIPSDLIVMGTHGRRGLTHMLLGSVAEKVLRSAPCPVITIRPEEEN